MDRDLSKVIETIMKDAAAAPDLRRRVEEREHDLKVLSEALAKSEADRRLESLRGGCCCCCRGRGFFGGSSE